MTYTFSFSYLNDDLQAYFPLRKELYKTLNEVDVDRDEHDQPGNILIAKKGDKVVGGLRIITSLNTSQCLPLEKIIDVKLQMLVPNLSQLTYCEIGRLCVLSTENTIEVSQKLVEIMLNTAVNQGCHYIFTLSPASHIKL